MTLRYISAALLISAAAALASTPEIQTIPSHGNRTVVRHPRVLPNVSTAEDEALGIYRDRLPGHWTRQSFNFGYTYPSDPPRYDYYTYVMSMPADSLLAVKVYEMMDSTLVAAADPSRKYLAVEGSRTTPRQYAERLAEKAYYDLGYVNGGFPEPLPVSAVIPVDNRQAARLNSTDAVYGTVRWWAFPFMRGEYITIALTDDLLFPAGALRSQENVLLTFDKETGHTLTYRQIIDPKQDATARKIFASAIASDLNRRLRSDRFTAESVLETLLKASSQDATAAAGDFSALPLPDRVALTPSGLAITYPAAPFLGVDEAPLYNAVIAYRTLEKCYEPLFKLYYDRHLSKNRVK